MTDNWAERTATMRSMYTDERIPQIEQALADLEAARLVQEDELHEIVTVIAETEGVY